MSVINQPLSDFVEPVIITYNRASLLRQTLTSFSGSVLKNITFHVLDNASSDDTEQVVRDMQSILPNLVYHRLPYNIGGNANILRAVEIAATPYHWVIGDDDAWMITPDLINELSTVLVQGEADLIRLGWLVQRASRGRLCDAIDLTKAEPMFFASISMISATIIKRSLLIEKLPSSYLNIADSYPQLVAPLTTIEQRRIMVYTLSQDLMCHLPSQLPGYFAGDFEWYAGWYRTSRFLHKKSLRKAFIREAAYYMCRDNPGIINEQVWMIKVLLYFKSFGIKQTRYLLTMLLHGDGRRLSVLILLLLNLLTPVSLLSFMRKLYLKWYRLPAKSIQVDRSRL